MGKNKIYRFTAFDGKRIRVDKNSDPRNVELFRGLKTEDFWDKEADKVEKKG